METIKAECSACGGTGLYSGFAEPKGIAVICLTCDGTGCDEFYYKPFTKRKGRRDILTVSRSRGRFIVTGVGPAVGNITYKEFKEGKMP